jgi:hypothetical protein
MLVVSRQRVVDEIEEVDGRIWREAVLPDSEADFVGQALERGECGRRLGEHIVRCRTSENNKRREKVRA